MSSKYPSVTCFCPLYKGDAFIKDYMEDMLRQTIFKDVEFYILDCSSPEHEIDTIFDYLKYDNITYERIEEDPGVYASWNLCIKNTKSDFLTNWNVDDRKSPWSLEVMRDFLTVNKNVDICYGETLLSNIANENWLNNTSTTAYPCNETNHWKDLLSNNNPHCMPMWRRSIHEKVGYFDENYKTASDADMWLKAGKAGSIIKKIHQIVGIYYKNPKGISSPSDKKRLREMIQEVNDMRLKYDKDYKPFPLPEV